MPEGTPIYVLTSNATFLAGITSLVFLRKTAVPGQVVIVGQEVGDRMRFRSEGNSMHLPNSGIRLRYSTGYHAYDETCGGPRRCFWLNYF